MAELSRRAGVPAPTIRYYLREGLLFPGELTSPNQASYDEAHVRRLRLVRALLEVGGLSVDAARGVIAAMAAKSGDEFAVLGQVQYGLTVRSRGDTEPSDTAAARAERLIQDQGWHVRAGNPSRRALAEAITTLEQLGRTELIDALDHYAETAAILAEREVDELLVIDDEDARAEAVIAADVLGDAILSALRRLAQESAVAERLDRVAGSS